MKAIFVFLFSIVFILDSKSFAQNLVPDGGFEIIGRLPKRKNNAVSCTKYWQCPMDDGAADYYHKDGKGHGKAPRNIFGRQKPHSGKAYGGMCIRKKFMEYVETKLSDTLVKDQYYIVEFYVSRAERSIGSVKEFGVLFTDKISMGITGVGIPKLPSVEIIKKHGFRKKGKWMKFTALYLAKGGETAMIVGHFNHNQVKRFKGYAHYYIDDVSVIAQQKEQDNLPQVTKQTIEENHTALPKLDEVIRLNNVFFDVNESELLPASYTELNQLVSYLNQLSNASIEISGHTDYTGDEVQNRVLSELRAKAVADYLILHYIASERIVFKGYGSAKPIATNTTIEGKKLNRRVDFILRNKD
jgi:outer membrane protein OmpA-like peptidoglycan-associated protein